MIGKKLIAIVLAKVFIGIWKQVMSLKKPVKKNLKHTINRKEADKIRKEKHQMKKVERQNIKVGYETEKVKR